MARDLKPLHAAVSLGSTSGPRRPARDPRSVGDFGSVAHVIGLHVIVLGAAMLIPFLIDIYDGNGSADGMLLSALLTSIAGFGLAVVTRKRELSGFSRPQAFLLTVAIWAILPAFGALPSSLANPLPATRTPTSSRFLV